MHNNFSGLFFGLSFTKLNPDFVKLVKGQFSTDSKLLLVCQEGMRLVYVVQMFSLFIPMMNLIHEENITNSSWVCTRTANGTMKTWSIQPHPAWDHASKDSQIVHPDLTVACKWKCMKRKILITVPHLPTLLNMEQHWWCWTFLLRLWLWKIKMLFVSISMEKCISFFFVFRNVTRTCNLCKIVLLWQYLKSAVLCLDSWLLRTSCWHVSYKTCHLKPHPQFPSSWFHHSLCNVFGFSS